ncbi:MAG: hypothetical protein ACOX3T_06410 [Bdellovibrionota bacterium]
MKFLCNKYGRSYLLYNRYHKLNIETVKNIIIDDNNAIYDDFKGYLFCQIVIEFLLVKYRKNILKYIIDSKEQNIFQVLATSDREFCSKLYNYFISKEYLVPYFLNLNKKTNHFTFYFSNLLNDKTLNDLIYKLENNFSYICDICNVNADEVENYNANVYIYDSISDFHYDLHNTRLDNWFTGESIIDTVCLVNPDKTQPPHDYNSQLNIALHEFGHIITLRDNKWRPPWLKEGVALYYANPTRDDIVKKSYLKYPLDDKNLYILFGDNYKEFQINGGYVYSHTIIAYIIKKYSLNTLKLILATLEKSPFEILEIEKKDFCYKWLNFFKNEYIDK